MNQGMSLIQAYRYNQENQLSPHDAHELHLERCQYGQESGTYLSGCGMTPPRPSVLKRMLKRLSNPDYRQICFTFYAGPGGGGCLVLARDGSAYVSLQYGVGLGGWGPSYSQGYIGGHPSNRQIDSFIGTNSAGASAGYFLGGSFVNGEPPDLSWNNDDAWEGSIGTPGVSFWTSYTWGL